MEPTDPHHRIPILNTIYAIECIRTSTTDDWALLDAREGFTGSSQGLAVVEEKHDGQRQRHHEEPNHDDL